MTTHAEPAIVVVSAAAPRVTAAARDGFARELAANRTVGEDQIRHQLRTAFAARRLFGL